MQTSDLVKVTSAHNMSSIVKYNMKTQKTQGQWGNQSQILHQSDLIGFYGTANHPALSLHQEGIAFARQAIDNLKLSNLHRKAKMNFTTLPNRLSVCHTIVQSFDYQANPDLKPQQVHHMGEQLLTGIKNYLMSNYHYRLDSGMISTHIDDDTDQPEVNGQIRRKHLHNHIIIPSYNDTGHSISSYLRKRDLYNFQTINDSVDALNNLKDYYLIKLKREVQPATAFTNKSTRTKHSLSNLQKAIQRFTRINNQAFDKYPNHFNQAKKYRNHELSIKYHFKTRVKPDTRTHKARKQFTMQDMITKQNHHIQWYNLMNLRLLVWRNKKEQECERVIKQLQIDDIKGKPITSNQYNQILIRSLHHLPQINQLNSSTERKNHQIYLQHIPQDKHQANISKNSQKFQQYMGQLIQDSQWKQDNHYGTPDNIKVLMLDNDIKKVHKQDIHTKQSQFQGSTAIQRQQQRNQQQSIQKKHTTNIQHHEE